MSHTHALQAGWIMGFINDKTHMSPLTIGQMMLIQKAAFYANIGFGHDTVPSSLQIQLLKAALEVYVIYIFLIWGTLLIVFASAQGHFCMSFLL